MAGMEIATVQQIAQLQQSGIGIFVRSQDLLFLMLERDNDVLKDWMDKGNALDTVFVPQEESLEFYSRALQQGIPLERLTIREDTPLYRDYIKRATSEMEKAGMSKEEIENVLQQKTFTCFEIRDVDKDRALHLRDTIERERNSNMILDADRANQMFSHVDTGLFKDLTKYQSEIFQRELAENGVHSSQTYDKDTKSYQLEVPSADMARPFENEMSRVEISVQDALFKMSLPEMKQAIIAEQEMRRSVNRAIQMEGRSFDEKEQDMQYSEKVIYDSFDPVNRIELKDGNAVLITKDDTENRIFDLSKEDDRRQLRRQIDRFNAPALAELNQYEKVRQMAMNDPDAFRENGFCDRADQVQSAFILEGVINQAAEKIRNENLIQTKFQIGKDNNGKVENVQKEMRIADSDKIKDVILQFKLYPQDIEGKENILKAVDDTYEQLMEEWNRNLAHMQIDKEGVHRDIEYEIYHDPIEMQDMGLDSNDAFFHMDGSKVDMELDDYFSDKENTLDRDDVELRFNDQDVDYATFDGQDISGQDEPEEIPIGLNGEGLDSMGMFDDFRREHGIGSFDRDDDHDGFDYEDEFFSDQDIF